MEEEKVTLGEKHPEVCCPSLMVLSQIQGTPLGKKLLPPLGQLCLLVCSRLKCLIFCSLQIHVLLMDEKVATSRLAVGGSTYRSSVMRGS